MPAVISLAGDLDIFFRDELRERLSLALTASHCVIDFTGFHGGDATFINELVYAAKVRTARALPSMVLVIPEEDKTLRRILEVTRLLRVWPVFSTVEAAVASLPAAPPTPMNALKE